MKWNENRLKQAFANMNAEGWDTSKPLKWGFTFMDTQKDKLLDVYNELKEHNYNIEFLKFRDDLNLWVLYVIKEETLPFDKLHRRNLAFEELADYCDVKLYDGWDVQLI